MNLSAASLAHLSKRNRWVVEVLAVAVVVFSVHFAHHGRAKHGEDNRTQGVRRSLVTKILDNDAPPRKRIALIRPFSTQDGEKMLNSFASWDDLLPCTAIDEVYDVDLVLSYSRRLDDGDSQAATDVMRAIQDEIMKAGEAGGAVGGLMHWSRCFTGHRIIETDIEVSSSAINFSQGYRTKTHASDFARIVRHSHRRINMNMIALVSRRHSIGWLVS